MAAVVSLVERDEGLTPPDWARAEFMETDAEQFRLTIAANAVNPTRGSSSPASARLPS